MVKKLLFALSLIVLCARMEVAEAADKPEIYRLQQGDSLEISVWHEDTMKEKVLVLPDGSISFPLAGRIEVLGLSTPEVEQLIATALKAFIDAPNVTVRIVGISGNTAYVIGKVLHPGPLIISGPLTVLQAISIAGGLDRFADESGIKVIRVKPNDPNLVPIRYKDITSGRDMTTNIQLKAGDTLVVP
jgi:polysaccharide export outer membrane protein